MLNTVLLRVFQFKTFAHPIDNSPLFIPVLPKRYQVFSFIIHIQGFLVILVRIVFVIPLQILFLAFLLELRLCVFRKLIINVFFIN